MPRGGGGRGRAKGKGRAQVLADGQSLRPARRPDITPILDSGQPAQQESFSEEKSALKAPPAHATVTEKRTDVSGLLFNGLIIDL